MPAPREKHSRYFFRCKIHARPGFHTVAHRFRTDPSTPRELNLKKLASGHGINRGGLQNAAPLPACFRL
jgi:hypothetical protein